jgi:hypothetical protein
MNENGTSAVTCRLNGSNLLELNVVSFASINEGGSMYNIQLLDWDWPTSKLFEWTLSKSFDEIRTVAEASIGSAAMKFRRNTKKYADSKHIEDPRVLNSICKEIEAMLRDILAFSKVVYIVSPTVYMLLTRYPPPLLRRTTKRMPRGSRQSTSSSTSVKIDATISTSFKNR